VATNFATLSPIPVQHAVYIGDHVFDARSLNQFFRRTNNPRNPYTRGQFPPQILQRYRHQIEARRREAEQERSQLQRMRAERQRMMLDYDNVLNELKNKTANRYMRSLGNSSRRLARVPSKR
jgi:hypothetical protein